jgi:hypothetical protein
VRKHCLLVPSCALAFLAMMGTALPGPMATTVRVMGSAGAAGSGASQVAYRLCTNEGGVRRCRWVEIYGPGTSQAPAPGVYGYQPPGPAAYGYQPPGPAAYGYQPPGPAAYGYQPPGPAAYGYQPPGPAAYGYQPPGPAAYGYEPPGPGVYGYQPPGPGVYGYRVPAPGVYGYQPPAPGVGFVNPPRLYRVPTEYLPTDPDDYPVGSPRWWRSMDRWDQGGQTSH